MNAGTGSDAVVWGLAAAIAIGSTVGYWLWSRAKKKELEALIHQGHFAEAEITQISGASDESGYFISYKFVPAGATEAVEFTETLGAFAPRLEVGAKVRVVYHLGKSVVAQALFDETIRAP